MLQQLFPNTVNLKQFFYPRFFFFLFFLWACVTDSYWIYCKFREMNMQKWWKGMGKGLGSGWGVLRVHPNCLSPNQFLLSLNPADYSLILVCQSRLTNGRWYPNVKRYWNNETQGDGDREVDAERRGGSRDKYIFVLCSVVAIGLVVFFRWFNVSGEQKGDWVLYFSLLSWGDCHQFASWHLNQPFQTGVLEMQMHWHVPCKIKGHKSERDTYMDMTVYCLRVFLSVVLCRKKVKSERFLFFYLALDSPCLHLEGCVRLGASFSPQTHGEDMIHSFPPSLHLSDATVI